MTERVDQFLREVLAEASGGLDGELTRVALGDMQKAIAAQMKALASKKYQRKRMEIKTTCTGCGRGEKHRVVLPGYEPESVARAAVATAKAGDTLARLSEFLAGKPDSRPEEVGRDWLRALSNEQVAVVMGWVEAAGRER